MATNVVVRAFVAAAVLGATLPVLASGGGDLPFSFKPDTGNMASLQRGARNYMNYCAGCHSLKYLRYNRLGKDLEIPEASLRQHLMFTSDKVGDHILSSMPRGSQDPTVPSDSEKWFGRAPPDLSLTARERGPDWIYSYLLSFYIDASRATGVNNLVLPGVSMPHVLGDLQGWQKHVVEAPTEGDHGGGHHKPKLEIVIKGALTPAEYKDFVADLTNFMVYAAEPGRNQRIALGVPVLAFTVLFGLFAWLLKREYWKDVH
ncbi:MAG TPA: cytochrome c1 [Verrucomicrobiae bacterium]|nr:cytochrome c1 [Verrucomicrobiae bacterium]